MGIDQENAVQAAINYAKEAASVSAELKAGSYASAQTLALISIAHSLAVLATHSRQS